MEELDIIMGISGRIIIGMRETETRLGVGIDEGSFGEVDDEKRGEETGIVGDKSEGEFDGRNLVSDCGSADEN